jgi:hypothetical protein
VELRELRDPREPRERPEPDGASVRAAICAARAIEVHGVALDEWGAMEARRLRARHARRLRARHARRRHVGRGVEIAAAATGPSWSTTAVVFGPVGAGSPSDSNPYGPNDSNGPIGPHGPHGPYGPGRTGLTGPLVRLGRWTCGIPARTTRPCSEDRKKKIGRVTTAVDLREQRHARPILLLFFAAGASKMRCTRPDCADRFALFNVPFDPPD